MPKEAARAADQCILEVDSPSYPPSDKERRQCGCRWCLANLKITALRAEHDSSLQKRIDLSLRLGQILGREYDGESLEEIARELTVLRTTLKKVKDFLNDVRQHDSSMNRRALADVLWRDILEGCQWPN